MIKEKIQENEKKIKIIHFNQDDINKFELKYKVRALKKDGTESKRFKAYLQNNASNELKKTVVEIKQNDVFDNSKISNESYEQTLDKNEFDKIIADLIQSSQSLKDNDKRKIEIQDKIKKLLTEQLNKQKLTMNTNMKALDVDSQDKLLESSENYIAYVYFFWSAETMNFKIIGLHSINPLFEFVNVKQTFYLIKPAMITNDTPIYFCFDKIPYSISFEIKDDMIKLTDYFIKTNTTSELFYFMEKNKTFIRIYGFNKIPLRIWIEFLLFIAFENMLLYIILLNVFNGVK